MTLDAAARRAIDDAQAICAVEAPTGAEGPRGELVARLLAEAGAPRVETDRAGNVIARFGEDAAAGGPGPVAFAAHLDTVFAAGTPLAFARDGDERLAAPGIGDNSLGVAALLHLARHLAEHPPARPLWLVATVGEEGLGDLRGAKALVADHGDVLAAFVAVEGTMADELVVGAVGSLRHRVTARGPGGHSWADRGTPSAVHALVRGLDAALAAIPRDRDDVAFNVGTIAGGTTVNAIASEAAAVLDLRCGDEAVLQQIAADVRAALTRADLTDGVAVALEQVGHRPGGALPAGHPLLDCARAAREQVRLPSAHEVASSTDANAAHGAGIPALTVGISTGGNLHRPDEYLDLAPVGAGLRALTALADAIASATAF